MTYDPSQVAAHLRAAIDQKQPAFNLAELFYKTLHALCPDQHDCEGRPVYFELPSEAVVLPLVADLDIPCLAIERTDSAGPFYGLGDGETYLVFDDLSFLAWDSEGAVDEALEVDNSCNDFRFEDLAAESVDLNFLAVSKAFLAQEGSAEAWRIKWGPTESRYPEDPSAEVSIYAEMAERVHDVRDPYVDHSDRAEEWSHERATELEEQIFGIAAAVLVDGHRMEITINSATEIDEEAEIDLEHYGPPGNSRRASWEIFTRLLNLHGLYGYELEYSDNGDGERMSSYYKSGLSVVSLEIDTGDFSAHERIEAIPLVTEALVKTGLPEEQANALLKAAHAGEPVPESIKPQAA